MIAGPLTRKRPAATGRGIHRKDFTFGSKPSTASRLPRDWRERLGAPEAFYREHVPGLGPTDSTGHASGKCPLCADRSGVLTVHAADPRGRWTCDAACGSGDAITFAQRLLALSFAEAVRLLLEVPHARA